MSKLFNEVLQANRDYVAGFDKGDLPMPPGRQFAILTCMDVRLDPAKYAGLAEGDAHVIRNAGGRASDDASGWQDCCEGPGSAEANDIDWLTIKDQAQSVTEDVVRIKSRPLVPDDIPVYGYIYDVKTGSLLEVPEASEAGKV